jgi:hypothetical protein
MGVGAGFIFHPWVTRGYPKFQIFMVSTQSAHLNSSQPQSFGLAQHYPSLKSRIVTLGDVYLTHQSHSSLGSSIRRALVIEFTSTLLKPAGDPKPGGCGHGRGCKFSPAGVAVGGFRQVPRVGFCQTRPESALLPSLGASSQALACMLVGTHVCGEDGPLQSEVFTRSTLGNHPATSVNEQTHGT